MAAIDTDRIAGDMPDLYREENLALLRRALAIAARQAAGGDQAAARARVICWIADANDELKSGARGKR